MKRRVTGYDVIFIGVFVYLFILQLHAIWPFTIDDMYISLRYARHWAAGEGLLWNLNAAPVEGYSNFSFVALGALSLLLNSDPVLVLKTAGVIGLFFTCISIYFITRFWFAWRESLLPCIGLLLYKGQIIWTASGLETTVYQALICGSVYFIFKGMGYRFFPLVRGESRSMAFVLAAALLALASMTRPEAPALIIVFFVLMCWDKPNGASKSYWKGISFFVMTLGVIFLPYFLWRWNYYGLLFPNSVYCKGVSTDSTALVDLSYLKLVWPFALLAVPACIQSDDKRPYFLWVPSLIYLIMLAASDPIVAFYNRLFLPAFVLLLPLALQGLSLILTVYLKHKDYVYFIALYALAFWVAVLFIPTFTLFEYSYFSKNPLDGEQLRTQVIQWLNTHSLSGDSVVLGDSGMIPYWSNLNFIDSFCLNNKIMGQYPVNQRYELFCRKILDQKPKVIILTSLIKHGQIDYAPSDLCLKNKLNKQSGYKISKVFSTKDPVSIYRYELFTNF